MLSSYLCAEFKNMGIIAISVLDIAALHIIRHFKLDATPTLRQDSRTVTLDDKHL